MTGVLNDKDPVLTTASTEDLAPCGDVVDQTAATTAGEFCVPAEELTRRPSFGESLDRLGRAAAAGVAAIVHPRLSPPTASAMRAAGFTRLADTELCEVWVRYPPV